MTRQVVADATKDSRSPEPGSPDTDRRPRASSGGAVMRRRCRPCGQRVSLIPWCACREGLTHLSAGSRASLGQLGQGGQTGWSTARGSPIPSSWLPAIFSRATATQHPLLPVRESPDCPIKSILENRRKGLGQRCASFRWPQVRNVSLAHVEEHARGRALRALRVRCHMHTRRQRPLAACGAQQRARGVWGVARSAEYGAAYQCQLSSLAMCAGAISRSWHPFTLSRQRARERTRDSQSS